MLRTPRRLTGSTMCQETQPRGTRSTNLSFMGNADSIRVPILARALGVLGGLGSAGLCVAGLVFEILPFYLEEPKSKIIAIFNELAMLTIVPALLVLAVFVFGASIYAVVDALRKARGGSAGFLVLFYVMGGGLVLASQDFILYTWEDVVLSRIIVGVTVFNLVAWIAFYRVHSRGTQGG